jgi:hypothetical protein
VIADISVNGRTRLEGNIRNCGGGGSVTPRGRGGDRSMKLYSVSSI